MCFTLLISGLCALIREGISFAFESQNPLAVWYTHLRFVSDLRQTFCVSFGNAYFVHSCSWGAASLIPANVATNRSRVVHDPVLFAYEQEAW